MSKLRDEFNDLQYKFNRLQKRIEFLEDEVKQSGIIADYITDDIVCPICGSKMKIQEITWLWFNSARGVKLECPHDHFITTGDTLKECVKSLRRIEVTHND